MVITGLESLTGNIPDGLSGKRAGILCHAPSIIADFVHITEIFGKTRGLKMGAIFGPQHGLFGETQDNMIEWNGSIHPLYDIPVYSLYGENRKPTPGMLAGIDALVIDLQDVGARLYTYAWTMKLCMEACAEAGIPVFVLDRPNPVAALGCDGPVLKEEFFTFVGGASIPLCHSMTMGELAIWLKSKYFPSCKLTVIPMKGWNRSMMYNETGLPWILPSPNMPTLCTAIVYPGMVLFEAMNISEGRGTTIPFELFGAPFINSELLLLKLRSMNPAGCSFRVHNFIPTFNKYEGRMCGGIQVHVTDIRKFRPVETAVKIIRAITETTGKDIVKFNDPPYEYEYNLMPFDILAGDSLTRKMLSEGTSINVETERWKADTEKFIREFKEISLYPD